MEESNNLISTCYLIQMKDGGFTFPTIYLVRPPHDENTQILHLFYNVFAARNYIRENLGDFVLVDVCKEAPDQHVRLVVCE